MYKKVLKCIPSFLKIIPFSVLALGIILNNSIELPEEYDNIFADIIIALLPMIFTIITIALSLPSEKIYGVSNIDFRRIRSKYAFSFLEMIICTIVIFSLYFIFAVLNMTITIWSLNIISIIYSIWFVVEEVPILSRSNKVLSMIISRAWKSRNYANFEYGNNSNDKILYDIIQNMVIENGIVSTYNLFKNKDDENNSRILDNLLSYNNDFLFECDENSQCFANSNNYEFNGINIINVIDMSLENISKTLSFNDDFNITKIFKDSSKYYHISRMIFALKRITEVLNLQEKYKKKMSDSFKILFMHLSFSIVDDSMFNWSYGFLNAMMTHSVSDNELWFIRLLRDSNYNSLFFVSDKDNYYYFVSVYLYYIQSIDNKVSNELKKNIQEFLVEEANGLNADGSTWSTIFNHKLNYTRIEEMINILPSLMKLMTENMLLYPWYQPKNYTSWSSDGGTFSKSLIINCWLEMIIFNYNNFDFQDNMLLDMIEKLKPEDRFLLASTLNLKWFSNNEFKPLTDSSSFLSMFNYHFREDIYESRLIQCLKEVKNKIMSDTIDQELSKHTKTEKDLIKYKQSLIDGFNKAVLDLACYDKLLMINNDNYLCFDSLFDTRWTDELIKSYNNNFIYSFKNMIRDLLINDDKIKHLKCDGSSADFIKIIDRYKYIAGSKFKLLYEVSEEDRSIINGKEEIDLWLPNPLFIKNNDSIKINIECDPNKSFVRKLSDNEINTIIDRDYKVTNGLYKYCESNDDSRSIFISREQLFDLINKKYFCARIVFRREIKINYNEVVFIDKDIQKS